MRYFLLKLVLKIALRLHFGRVEQHGLELIDNGRPTLILSNHTNSFLDTFAIGYLIKRRIWCFVRGDMFEKKWADRLMRSVGLLPVFRINEGKDKLLQHHDTSNEEALAVFRAGGALVIYAEGGSETVKVLRPLKKGPFRLAAIAAAGLEGPPLIVAMGVNYTMPTKLFSNVYLQVGAVTETAPYRESEEAGQNKSALRLMRQVSDDIRPLVWHVERKGLVSVADGLLRLQQDRLHHPTFAQTQAVIARLNGLDDAAADALAVQWERFTALEAQLRPGILHRPEALAVKLPIVLLGAPVALAGWLLHLPPTYISRVMADRKSPAPDFYSGILLGLNIILVGLWYLLLFIGVSLAAGLLTGLAVLAALTVSGVFYLKLYRVPFLEVYGAVRNSILARRHPARWAELEAIYQQLLPLLVP